jgi:hypothetical protein
MGTRSLTRVKDGMGQTILTMYRQMDGYLEGHGAELVTFLDGMVITNGINLGNQPEKSANGIECLAAQLVAHFKVGVGGFYLYPENAENEEFNYLIELVDGQLTLAYEAGGKTGGILFPTKTENETENVVEFLYPARDNFGGYGHTSKNVWRKVQVTSQDDVYITGYDLNEGKKFKRFLVDKVVGGASKIFTK